MVYQVVVGFKHSYKIFTKQGDTKIQITGHQIGLSVARELRFSLPQIPYFHMETASWSF